MGTASLLPRSSTQGLVDEIHAGIHPFLVGNAEDRLRTPHPVGLRLLGVQAYDSGTIAARYAPASS